MIGAGLSGSAVAYSLAVRGWSVTVLDQAEGVGAGASGLPAGLAAPHVSPDDNKKIISEMKNLDFSEDLILYAVLQKFDTPNKNGRI